MFPGFPFSFDVSGPSVSGGKIWCEIQAIRILAGNFRAPCFSSPSDPSGSVMLLFQWHRIGEKYTDFQRSIKRKLNFFRFIGTGYFLFWRLSGSWGISNFWGVSVIRVVAPEPFPTRTISKSSDCDFTIP